jgi:hypothetical protein
MADYWFYHEYLDEERRFRIHRVNCETEVEARRLHRQACAFAWVTHHVEPSVSSLFTKADAGQRTLVQGHRPGDRYHTDFRPVPMPDYLRELLKTVRSGNETALSGVRPPVDRKPMPDARPASRAAAKQDGFDTPF